MFCFPSMPLACKLIPGDIGWHIPVFSGFACGCTVLPIAGRARAFRELLGEVIRPDVRNQQGPALLAPPPRAGLICTTHETGIF